MNGRLRNFSIFFLIALSVPLIFVNGQYNDPESLCASQQTCDKCLQTPRCVWCSQLIFGLKKPLIRCITREKYQKVGNSWCNESFVVHDDSSTVVVKNDSLASGKHPVQVQPQRMKLRLRRGETYTITLKYKQAEDYPVDLYYLLDLSASMKPYKDHLSKLGNKIADAIHNLTSNFRLGFGSFVDKVVLPMTRTHPDLLKRPCSSNNAKECAPPYSYKNQMPLTGDISLFKSYVSNASISGNLDGPEGGLDALMQAMVCMEQINWRSNARRLIVFTSDTISHIAGDGKLAGIVEPNDCLCHMDDDGFYTYSTIQDYPSVGQIRKISREYDMNLIFALATYSDTIIYESYKQMSEMIAGSSIGTIDANSQNIVALIMEEYKKIVSSVSLEDKKPNWIDIKYFSRCLNSSGKLLERSECGDIRVKDVIEFKIDLKAVECPADPNKRNEVVEIKPRGLNESLIIEIDLICSCNCKAGSSNSSMECKGRGKLTCGLCVCDEGFYGKQCECEGYEFGSVSGNITEDCKANNMSAEICSGHGVCICGSCECTKRPNSQELFGGKYCECDNFSCKRSGGQVCGGHGTCECGKCICHPTWSGETCNCKETNSTCIRPMATMTNSYEICSGRGDCICGKCQCHEKDNIRYSGKYCEECATCPGQKCDELKNCVECQAHGTGPYIANGKCTSCEYDIELVEEVKEDPENDGKKDAHICRTPGDGGCSFVFKYEYSHGRGDIQVLTIHAEKKRECPVPINVFGVAMGVIVGTIFLGSLGLLIWKAITTLHDRREYQKFEKERALAKWDRGENPLFKGATMRFKNPTFNEEI